MSNSTSITRSGQRDIDRPPPSKPEVQRAALLALIQGLNASASQNWDTQVNLYDLLLSRWPMDLAIRVTQHAALNCKWRPSPLELRQIAARMESPRPTEDQALDEVLSLINRVGAMAKRDPKNPNCRIAGEPAFTHPLVAATVRRVGGWEMLCAGDSQHQSGGLQGAFRAAYNRACEEWDQEVMACLDRGERPAEWFPPYLPFAPAQLATISLSLQSADAGALRLPAVDSQPVPMPDRVRATIDALNAKTTVDLDSPEATAALNQRRLKKFSAARALAELVEGGPIPAPVMEDAPGSVTGGKGKGKR